MADPSPKVSVGKLRFSAPFRRHEGTSLAGSTAPALLLCLLAACFPLESLAQSAACGNWDAELFAVEGTVERRTPGGWERLDEGARLCAGDELRTRVYSRAAVRFRDESWIRLDEDTAMVLAEPEDDSHFLIKVLKGLIHVINRDPRDLAFDTPFVNAGLEGTEVVIRVADDRTEVTVLEGAVVLDNAAGTVSVPSGQRGTARRGSKPEADSVADAATAISWTPYYVPILGRRLPAADQAPTSREAQAAGFYSRRAASRMSVGQVVPAAEDLERALQLDSEHADAFALEALIALGRNDTAEALELAQRATVAGPDEPAGWLALSYAEAAQFALDRALAGAETAARLAPDRALAWARIGELRLATNDPEGGREAAERAAALDPDLALAHGVLGFAELNGGSRTLAETSFREAIALDPAAPFPRLGLALALIRQGRLEDGRRQMEMAVLLDPTDALARSYMAKIYDAEGRDALGGLVLELAKALDSHDPTAWVYDALRKQHENRPVEALWDLRAANDLNDGRPTSRSQLMIDEDLAARSAGIGSIHRTAGSEELALREAYKAVVADPADHVGHRLLADVYSFRPRHQIARVREFTLAQLLQPLNVTPVRPQLAEANLFFVDTAGPSPIASSEFHPLVQENGPSYQGSAVVAGNGTRGADVAVSGLHDRVAYSAGYYNWETEGFRSNNDLDQQVANALVQFRPKPGTTLSAELRSSRASKGDLRLLFGGGYEPNLRVSEAVDSARLGLRRQTGGGTLLALLVSEQVDVGLNIAGASSRTGSRRGNTLDLQYLTQLGPWQLIGGGKYLNQRQEDAAVMKLPHGIDVSSRSRHDIGHVSAYLYGHVELGGALTATIGANLERVESEEVDRQRFNPKLGLIWEPSASTTVRAAAFRTLQTPLISKHHIQPSLEPTHVAGLNQPFFGPEGEEAWRYGIAVDHEFSDRLFAGLEVSRRDLESPISTVPPGSAEPLSLLVDSREHSRHGYLYWTPSPRIGVAASYQYDRFDSGNMASFDGFTRIRTHRLPVRLGYFHRSGLSASFTATFVDQAGDFSPAVFQLDPQTEPGEDQFWTADLSLGYRLPSRRGQISLNVHNATNEEFRFQDIDPENPRILPERIVLMRITLSY